MEPLSTGFVDPRLSFLDDPGPGASTVPTEGDDYLVFAHDNLDGEDLGLSGSPGMIGLGGNDTLVAGSPVGMATGGPGDDVLVGSLEPGEIPDIVMFGGEGNDTLYSGVSGGSMWGGPGDDTYHIFPVEGGRPWFRARDDQSRSIDDFNPQLGDAGFDTLYQYGTFYPFGGTSHQIQGVDRIVAVEGAGDMWLRSEPFILDDVEFVGNEGRNVLIGHGGSDRMTGGAGADIFVIGDNPYMDEDGDLLVTILDFDDRDSLVFDDALLLEDTAAEPQFRAMTEEDVNGLLESGMAAYSRSTGQISIDWDRDGTLEVVAELGADAPLGFSDLYWA